MKSELRRYTARVLGSNLVVEAYPALAFRMVLPTSLIRFVCGDAINPNDITEQQQIFVVARPSRHGRLAPAPGSKPCAIDAAFDAMKVPRLSLPGASRTCSGCA